MLVAGIVVGALGALVHLENRYVLSPIWAAMNPLLSIDKGLWAHSGLDQASDRRLRGYARRENRGGEIREPLGLVAPGRA